MCKIDKGRGMQCLVTISALLVELSKDNLRGPYQLRNGARLNPVRHYIACICMKSQTTLALRSHTKPWSGCLKRIQQVSCYWQCIGFGWMWMPINVPFKEPTLCVWKYSGQPVWAKRDERFSWVVNNLWKCKLRAYVDYACCCWDQRKTGTTLKLNSKLFYDNVIGSGA